MVEIKSGVCELISVVYSHFLLCDRRYLLVTKMRGRRFHLKILRNLLDYWRPVLASYYSSRNNIIICVKCNCFRCMLGLQYLLFLFQFLTYC